MLLNFFNDAELSYNDILTLRKNIMILTAGTLIWGWIFVKYELNFNIPAEKGCG